MPLRTPQHEKFSDSTADKRSAQTRLSKLAIDIRHALPFRHCARCCDGASAHVYTYSISYTGCDRTPKLARFLTVKHFASIGTSAPVSFGRMAMDSSARHERKGSR
jgi:hypothetical protein